MFHTLSNTWELMGYARDVLLADKELLIFPLVAGVVSLGVLATFAGGGWALGMFDELDQALGDEQLSMQDAALVAFAFAYYFVSYFVVIYFNAALIGAAHMRLQGGDPGVADGFRAATACLPSIFVYTLIAATVGVVLRLLRGKSDGIVGQLIGGLLGFAWTLITFLVVPVMVVERAGAPTAIRRSATLLRQTWGEQIVADFGFGILAFLLALPGVLLATLAGWLLVSAGGVTTSGVLLAGMAVVYWILLAAVMSALQGIFKAALYCHAAGQRLEGFPADVAARAFTTR